MKKIYPLAGVILSAALLSVSPATFSAEHEHHEPEHHEHRQHDSHEHGSAILNIAIEENSLHLELESPAMNIVGFEHVAKNHEQQHAIEHATKELKDGDKLFILTPAAHCTLTEAHVKSPLIESSNHQSKDKETHSEFHANYVFQCKQISSLKNIDVQLFQSFSATDEIKVQLINNHGQTTKELTSSNHTLVVNP